MKIRQRDGTMREVDDGYIMKDGEALLVPLNFMDARRSMIHDGHGNPAGQRPGFLFADDERAAQAVADAYRTYDDAISRRWQSDRWQDEPSKPAPTASQVFHSQDAAEAAREAAYRQYDHDLSNRWRGK
jgi:hypothetical protein